MYTDDMSKSKSGFTIVELLMVIVVIGILAAITVVAYTGIQQRGRDAQRKSDIASIVKALELYYADNGSYPSSGGSTSVNSSWSSSADTSWTSFKNYLTNYAKNIPSDTFGTAGNSAVGGNGYSYDYFMNSGYCGTASGQGYILVYHLQSTSQENKLLGNCSTNPVGPYSGLSNYRVMK
jgi:general secretion pathway protein G